MNVDISSILNYRVNYCVSALLSFCTNCTHTVINLLFGLINLFLLYMFCYHSR